MSRLLIGLALIPTSLISLFVAAQSLWLVAGAASVSWPFLLGMFVFVLVWFFCRGFSQKKLFAFCDRMMKRVYVLGHELTHAVAAWGLGAKISSFKVSVEGGHVDVSRSNFFVSLAPYCIPFYTVLIILGFRVFLWIKPEESVVGFFLAAIGFSLAFHWIKTSECLWDVRQPDLDAAGGVFFSLALIGISNGILLLLILKTLFPRTVLVMSALETIGRLSFAFWIRVSQELKNFALLAAKDIKKTH